jgi:hypothetical protein
MVKANQSQKNLMKFYRHVNILLILGCTKVVASDPAIQVKKIWD